MENAKDNGQGSREVSRAVARIHADALAFVLAVICGGSLFLMTIWLVIKDGENAGPHLRLLSQYFIGYTVTWTGSVIGFFYGACFGAMTGWLVGKIYNMIVDFRSISHSDT